MVHPWQFPQELLDFTHKPVTIRRRTPEEEFTALVVQELQEQHAAIQFLLEQQLLGSVHRGRQARVEVSESDG